MRNYTRPSKIGARSEEEIIRRQKKHCDGRPESHAKERKASFSRHHFASAGIHGRATEFCPQVIRQFEVGFGLTLAEGTEPR